VALPAVISIKRYFGSCLPLAYQRLRHQGCSAQVTIRYSITTNVEESVLVLAARKHYQFFLVRPPFTKRWIGTRRRYYHDYCSNCGATVLETEHEALNNNFNPFLMTVPLGEIRSCEYSTGSKPVASCYG
jgi:hypothetical protein